VVGGALAGLDNQRAVLDAPFGDPDVFAAIDSAAEVDAEHLHA
jgi:hypothetical protein